MCLDSRDLRVSQERREKDPDEASVLHLISSLQGTPKFVCRTPEVPITEQCVAPCLDIHDSVIRIVPSEKLVLFLKGLRM